jgi:aldose 1-epimerase
MAFSVQTRTQPGVQGRDPTFYALDDGAGGRAEVWPALGFNCFSWRTVRDGRTLDLLYADPALFGDGRPTRSGIPVLFPFPNRIRDGRFTWDGRTYQLPLNDPAQKNAIHGFACRRPWRVVGRGADAAGAWLTGEFHGARDAADCRDLWPADYLLRVTYRLTADGLAVEAEVVNPDAKDLPFGLGYHPYLRTPFAPGAAADDCTVQAPARALWPLTDSLPDGPRQPPDAARDLNAPRRVGDLRLDDVLTELPTDPEKSEGRFDLGGLYERARLRCGDASLRLLCTGAFRELVVFTPPHRQAFCAEPYTCATDAVNLQAQGLDAGWRTLPPGGRFTAVVELRV